MNAETEEERKIIYEQVGIDVPTARAHGRAGEQKNLEFRQ